jgi:dolichyl-phosphate-mannose-protein mannosyltransferase
VVAIVAVTAIAAFLRFFHLAHPPDFVFDEVYYPKAGCILIGESDDVCQVDSSAEKYWREQKWDVGSWVHPPLGKWQIGLGIKAFGMDSFGWRVTSALAGTLVVLLTAILAHLLFRSALWAFVAGSLMALENLNIVMSRTALLDVHLELWIVAGYLFLVLDRRWIERREHGEPDPPETADPDPTATAEPRDNSIEPAGDDGPTSAVSPPTWSPIWRPWRFAAGVAFGAAVAVKWSGAMALFGAIVLTYVWETSRRRRHARSAVGAFGRAFLRESFGVAVALALVPFAVYFATWLPWFHHFGYSLVHDPVASFARWAHEQGDILRYHREGLKEFAESPSGAMTPTHPYYARPATWIVMLRPISFFIRDLGPDIQQVLAIGNPAVFWGSLIAMPYAAFMWARARDWRAGLLLLPFLAQYLPWFLVDRPQFFFYVLPMTPFMVLAVTYLVRDLSEATIVVRERETGEVAINPETGAPAVSQHHPYLPFVVAYLAVAVALTVWFWPVLTAGQVSDTHWKAIVWFRGWI